MTLDWSRLAERMTTELGDSIGTPQLRRAFLQTPRHVFLPSWYRHWFDPDTGDSGWEFEPDTDPATVYTDDLFVTQVRPDPTGRLVPTCSSSQPSLMATMIEYFGIRPGMKVLEIGTGTGYNAAILCHILGEDNVATIDIDPGLLSDAAQRLASIGHHPRLGQPETGAYDRVLATCAVDRIPLDWTRWTKPGGLILTDFRALHVHTYVGGWALLTVHDDGTATGTLTPSRGHFMGLRTDLDRAPGPEACSRRYTDLDRLRTRDVIYPKTILGDPAFEFYLWRHFPQAIWATVTHDRPADEQVNLTTLDGRWASVSATRTSYFAPDDLWGEAEYHYDKWIAAGKPTIDAYSIHVTTTGETTVHLELP